MEQHYLDCEYIPRTEEEATGEELALREALERVEIKERRIREAYENEIDTLEEYRQNKSRLKAEKEQLTASLQKLLAKADMTAGAKPSQEEIMQKVSNVYEILMDPEIDYERKGNALRSICKKIVLDRETRHFTFFYYTS